MEKNDIEMPSMAYGDTSMSDFNREDDYYVPDIEIPLMAAYGDISMTDYNQEDSSDYILVFYNPYN